MAIECRECGNKFEAKRRHAAFCCDACRKAWNNRRMVRGAELYDLLMAHNYERDKRAEADTWSLISRQCRAYRDSDKAIRNGRKSWDVDEAVQRIPLAYSDEGDKR